MYSDNELEVAVPNVLKETQEDFFPQTTVQPTPSTSTHIPPAQDFFEARDDFFNATPQQSAQDTSKSGSSSGKEEVDRLTSLNKTLTKDIEAKDQQLLSTRHDMEQLSRQCSEMQELLQQLSKAVTQAKEELAAAKTTKETLQREADSCSVAATNTSNELVQIRQQLAAEILKLKHQDDMQVLRLFCFFKPSRNKWKTWAAKLLLLILFSVEFIE